MPNGKPTQGELLARIDERTRAFERDLARMDARFSDGLGSLKGSVDKLRADVEKEYITTSRFAPVERIVYGLVALVLVAVAGGVIKLVVLP